MQCWGKPSHPPIPHRPCQNNPGVSQHLGTLQLSKRCWVGSQSNQPLLQHSPGEMVWRGKAEHNGDPALQALSRQSQSPVKAGLPAQL